jgi:hypothetical protein
MLTWTAAGAVERPRTLQIRLQRTYPGRVRAGAPVPTRSMSGDEVESNLLHFTRAGPRVTAVDALVISGVGAASRPDLGAIAALARSLGITRVTLHAGVEDLPTLGAARPDVDLVVIPLQPAETADTLTQAAGALAACAEQGLPVLTNTVLTPQALPLLPAVGRIARRARVQSQGFTYPFPVDGQVEDLAPAPRAVAALAPVVDELVAAGVPVWIKGLPACYLGRHADRLGRSANRWYVDADHQLGDALLFFPDVVAFTKLDTCRFCLRNERCDGFFATYLRRPGFPPLQAVTEEPPSGPRPARPGPPAA